MPNTRPRRAKYTERQKQLVRDRYPLCRTLEDKEALAAELGMTSIHKLYNLASRLRVTRSYDEWNSGEEAQEERPERYDPGADESRLRMRESFSETTFSDEDRRFLRANFGRLRIEDIAFHRGHTETAMLYLARHMGLRRPARLWEAGKVLAWLGMDADDWDHMIGEGVDRFMLRDRRGRVQVDVVTTTSVARWLVQGNRWQRLIQAHGADEFFIREIIESVALLRERRTEWEACTFLTAGHTCCNSFASNSFGLFCTNSDRYEAGRDPKCAVRSLSVEDVANPAMDTRDVR